MAIQNRRGDFKDFDPYKMVPGEFAIITSGDPNSKDGTSVYHCFAPGVVKRLTSYEELKEQVESLLTTIRNSIPTKISQLADDSTHRTVTDTEKQTWNNKANAATTLAGYGITDGSTKEQFNQLSQEITDLQDAIGAPVDYNYTVERTPNSNSRLRTDVELPMKGDTVTIAATGNYQFAPIKGDRITTWAAWTTNWTANISDIKSDGLNLWIQKADKSEIKDDEISEAIASVKVVYKFSVADTGDTAFVSVTGDDNNSGSYTEPFATVSHAIEEGARNIFVFGGTYEQQIKLPGSGVVRIAPAEVGNAPVFVSPERLVVDSAAVYSNAVESVLDYEYTVERGPQGNSPNTRLRTNVVLPMIGTTVTITASGNYNFAPIKSDNITTWATWKTEWTANISDIKSDGLNLWIQKTDKSEITDEEIAEAVAAVKVTYSGVVNPDTAVYVADTSFSNLVKTPRIFQDGVPDATTLISAAERLPQQRGKEYRCDDTRIYKCTATVLADAITEMQSDGTYKFFYDKVNSKLYFNAPNSDFAAHPVCCSAESTKLFTNLSQYITLCVTGIECKYMHFDISETVNSVIADCKASCAYASALGQFIFDNSINPRFVRCEACLSHGASNGDGFNAHASTSTDDVFAYQSGTVMEDCWSHDNMDDGYSEHYRGEAIIIGGLFEYNGKGGVTPSYGTHCSCHNVYSRNNQNGFYYIAEASEAEGGVGGQMICYGCIAENNNAAGTKSGFRVNGVGNSMTLIDCKAVGNDIGFNVGTGCRAKLIDCRASGNNTLRTGDGYEIVTTTAVS